MAENESGSEKKHAPSEQKWAEAANKGQLPKSMDAASAVVIFCGTAALYFGSEMIAKPILAFTQTLFTLEGEQTLDIYSANDLLFQSQVTILSAIAIPLTAVAFGGTVISLVQTQFQGAPNALDPDINRLNPLTGFQQRYMSWTPLVELGKGLGKLSTLALAVSFALRQRMDIIPHLAVMSPQQFLLELGTIGWQVSLYSFPVLIIIGAGDYSYSFYKMYENLKSTDQEVKDENKQQEGDPHVKAQRRARARQIAMQNTLGVVKEADVLVVNPTHYAVAIRYNRALDGAPVVLAKGIDALALKMRQEALKHDIPRIENRPLARALYANVKSGFPVPEEYFIPVAKVLAVVYKRRQKRKG